MSAEKASTPSTEPVTSGVSTGSLLSAPDKDLLTKILGQLQQGGLEEEFTEIVSFDGQEWSVKKVSNGILFTVAGVEVQEFEDLGEYEVVEEEVEEEEGEGKQN